MSRARDSAVGIIKEASFGAGGTVNLWLHLLQDRWQGEAIYESPAGARKTIGTSPGEMQAYRAAGGGQCYVHPDLGALLYLLMGADASVQVAATTAYDHTMTFGVLKSFIAQRDVGGIHVTKWIGNVVNRFSFIQDRDSTLKLDFATICKNDANDTVTNPSFTTKKGLAYRMLAAADVLVGGSANARVSTFRIDVDIPQFPQRHAGDLLFISGVTEGKRTVSGQITLEFLSDADYRAFMYGLATNTQPNANPTLSSLKVIYTSEDLIEAGQPYKLTLECPKIWFPSAPAQFNDATGMIEMTASFQAGESAAQAKDDFKLVLRNNVVAAYS